VSFAAITPSVASRVLTVVDISLSTVRKLLDTSLYALYPTCFVLLDLEYLMTCQIYKATSLWNSFSFLLLPSPPPRSKHLL